MVGVLVSSVVVGLLCVGVIVGGGNKYPALGAPAPQFSLVDDQGNNRTLQEFRGKKVVLYFYPKDASAICTKQACELRDSYAVYEQNGVVVLGVSYDSPAEHKKFKEQYHLPFTLLSDSTHKVAKAYGAYSLLTGWLVPDRTTYLINEEGKLIHIFKKIDVKRQSREILAVFGIT